MRELLHEGFRSQARQLSGISTSDPQCGVQAFAPMPARCSSTSRTDGFAFDVEILMLAERLGMRVAEVPVSWHAVEGSKVRVVRHSVTMLVGDPACTDAARRQARAGPPT